MRTYIILALASLALATPQRPTNDDVKGVEDCYKKCGNDINCVTKCGNDFRNLVGGGAAPGNGTAPGGSGSSNGTSPDPGNSSPAAPGNSGSSNGTNGTNSTNETTTESGAINQQTFSVALAGTAAVLAASWL